MPSLLAASDVLGTGWFTVLDALVELVYAFHPNGDGPHFSGGTIGMASIVRALTDGGRDDVLWDLLQENDQPSYGFFMTPTTANPNGMTTIGELGPWSLEEPHYPRPDRGVVPHRTGGHPRGRPRRHVPVAGHPAEGRR